MYRRVLAAYDGSREGRAALREAVILGRRMRAELHLLAVIAGKSGAEMEGTIYANILGDREEQPQSILQEAVTLLASRGVEIQASMVRGDPVAEISAYAREIRADLVVVGYRRQSIMERWWSGAKGAFLSDHLDCTLLIARNEISQEDFLTLLSEEERGSVNR